MQTLFRARWVVPMSPDAPGRVIEDGGVLVDGGRIAAVGLARELSKGGIEEIDLGDVMLLPGLVNAHTHLELSDRRPGERPKSFGDWIGNIARSRITLGVQVQDAVAHAAKMGAQECLNYGVTCVGDISRFAGATRPVLAESPLRVVSFGEVQAMAGRRGLLDMRLAEATDLACDGWNDERRMRVAITPHAPYTVEPEGYRRCLDWAVANDRPFCTHLAETTEEATFLADQIGPFRELWDSLRDWDELVPRHAGGPIRFAKDLGLLDAPVPVLLAHVNHVDEAEMELLEGGRASVVYCPRTHAFFGHPPHPVEAMLSRGLNVCIGTDSRASSPDLNLVDDLRLITRDRPHLSAAALWSLVTWRPALALGLADDLGTIAAGRYADFVAFPADGSNPVNAVLREAMLPSTVIVNGQGI